ncbi:unnamed protein product [Hapterophycus canaliculatus]
MDSELQSLTDSNTFAVLAKLSDGEKAVGSRWGLSHKQDKDAMTVKTKARLFVQAVYAERTVRFFQTSAPAPAASSMKTTITVADELGYRVHHLDTKQAFTEAELDRAIHMKRPGWCGSPSGKTGRSLKALYGLRRRGLLWNELLVKQFVMRMGMEHCLIDPRVFRKTEDDKAVLMVVVHVDDTEEAGT